MSNLIKIQTIINEDTASRIENINNSFNSSSSMKSLDSYIKLLTENKATVDTTTQAISPPNEKAFIIPSQHTPISRTRPTNLLLNPYISQSIKTKMNAIITDNNIPNSTFNRYQSYTNSKNIYFGRTNSIIANSTMTSSVNKMNFDKASFTCSLYGNGKESSISKVIQMKHKLEKTINSSQAQMTFSNRIKYINYPTTTNVKRAKTGGIVSLKKRLYEESKKEVDIYQKGLDLFTPRKVNTFTIIPKSDNIKKNFKLLKSQTYSSRLFM